MHHSGGRHCCGSLDRKGMAASRALFLILHTTRAMVATRSNAARVLMTAPPLKPSGAALRTTVPRAKRAKAPVPLEPTAAASAPNGVVALEAKVPAAAPLEPADVVLPRAKRAKPPVATPPQPAAAKAGSAGGMRAKERALSLAGYKCIVGVDEAGRGPLAGPVVAAACYIPPHVDIAGIADSKVLSEAMREAIFEELTAHAEVRYAVSIQPPAVIDEINILQATLLAMRECVSQLRECTPELDYVLVDGNKSPFDEEPAGFRCETVIKGDAHCLSIAAASIIAKVTRDRLMMQMDLKYPQFEFGRHKGYPTARHVALLVKHGPCVEHRRSFAPVRNALRAPE